MNKYIQISIGEGGLMFHFIVDIQFLNTKILITTIIIIMMITIISSLLKNVLQLELSASPFNKMHVQCIQFVFIQ